MINTIKGDLLSIPKGIIVHGCNCQAVMGSGIAKAIKDKWHDVFGAYRDHQTRTGLRLGDIVAVAGKDVNYMCDRHLSRYSQDLPNELIVVNAMTQYSYGRDEDIVYVDYDAVFAAFARVNLLARDSGLSVNFPLIGCGLGNGDWEIVSSCIEAALDDSVEKNLFVLE